jgi:hypothetical protein
MSGRDILLVNPFTWGVHGFFTFFTKDGATKKNFVDLGKLACQRGPVCMLVSIPFRDVVNVSQLSFWRTNVLLYSSNVKWRWTSKSIQ